MKKKILRYIAYVLAFLIATVVINKIMNKDYDNLTVDISEASLPVVNMLRAGEAYNSLYGNTEQVDLAFVRDTVSILGENRELEFEIKLYDHTVDTFLYEVRDKSGNRLIENGEITDIELNKGTIHAKVALKDLYEKGEEYIFVVHLDFGNNLHAYYSTRIIWSSELHEMEKLAFIKDFHDRLYDKEAAKEITKYLEPNSSLADNSTLHKVNIHSSFKQITWGDLNVREYSEPRMRITEISNQTISVLLDYLVSYTNSEKEQSLYLAQEYYRVRYTPDRMYLLDYERTVDQLPDVENMYANDKIIYGIADDEVDMVESGDGNTIVFQNCNRLFSYNIVTNKLVVLFSFYEDGDLDERTLNRNHGLRILGVDEAGNVEYAVYGYMNRGIHEGRTGILVRRYESATNTTRECLFVPSSKPFEVMKAEVETLMFLNKDDNFYFFLEQQVFCADLTEMVLNRKAEIESGDFLLVSEDQQILLWQDQENGYGSSFSIENLNEKGVNVVTADAGEVIKPLKFIGEDIIYGVARRADLVKEITGDIFVPMYKIIIADCKGNTLKTYENEDVFVTDCEVQENHITLSRVKRKENGTFESMQNDHITNNRQKEEGRNKISAPVIDTYGKYVQIQVKNTIDEKGLQILNPKDILFEDGRELTAEALEEVNEQYYVYGPYGVELITGVQGDAVTLAYERSGAVINRNGEVIWKRAIRATRNQLMAIKEPEKVDKEASLSVCLDTMLAFEGIQRNTGSLLVRGKSVETILADGLEGHEILNLKGCKLDAVLYYVNRETPVLAFVGDEAVLITGFNEFNTVIFQPSTGKLYKKGINDSAAWFEKYGNQFYTYCK